MQKNFTEVKCERGYLYKISIDFWMLDQTIRTLGGVKIVGDHLTIMYMI